MVPENLSILLVCRVAGARSRGWIFLSEFERNGVNFGTCAKAEAVIVVVEGAL